MQKVIVFGLIVVVALALWAGFAPSASASVLSPFDGPGYGMGVTDASLLADHTQVYLTCVTASKIVVRTTPNYWVIRDTPGGLNAAIIICAPAPRELKLGQNIDVSGELVTLENGFRGLINCHIFAYLDEDTGQIISNGRLFRGLLTAPWPTLREIFPPQIITTQSVRVLDDGDPLPPGGNPTPDAPLNAVFCNTISDVRAAYSPDSRVLVQIDAHPISDPSTDTGTFNLVEPDSSDSIPVCYSGVGNMASSDNANTCVATVQLDSTGSAYLECDQGPNFLQGDQPGWVQDIPHNLSIGDARAHQWPYTISLEPLEVTTSPGDFGGAFYAQGFVTVNSAGQIDSTGNIHHTGGIRVVYSGTPPALGAVVDVTGTTTKSSDGESVIDSVGSVQIDSNYTGAAAPSLIKPLGMTSNLLGGKAFNSYWPGVAGGFGVYDEGMLVKVAGTVTAVDPIKKFFYVDDGCHLSDSTGNGVGVKVSWAWALGTRATIIPPQIGWVVGVTGIASSDSAAGGIYYRVLRPRNQSDIVVYTRTVNRTWPSPAPSWANPAIPHDSAPTAGPSSADSVDLATGVGQSNPDPDIYVDNPIGPDAEFTRIYRSNLAEAGSCCPGLSPGWESNYNVTITANVAGVWGDMTLNYPDGAKETLSPVVPGGSPTGAFASLGRPYVVTGQPGSTTGLWNSILITYDDESSCTFQSSAAYDPNTYLLTKVTDSENHFISVNRFGGADIRLSSITDGNGYALISFGYNGVLLNTATDNNSHVVTYAFNTQQGQGVLNTVSQINNSNALRWRYTYSSTGATQYLTQVEVPDPTGTQAMRGHPICYGLDGKVQALGDANGNSRSFVYNSDNTQVTVKDATGAVAQSWTAKIGPKGQNAGEIDALNNSTSIAYEEDYLPSSFTNKNGQTTTIKYDSDTGYTGSVDYGRLRTITEPTQADSAGLTTTLTYGDVSHPFRVTQVQTGTKTPTILVYDSAGNAPRIVEVDTPTPGTVGANTWVKTFYTYTALGNVQTVKAPSDGNASITTVFNYTSDIDTAGSGPASQSEQLNQPLVITAYEGDSTGNQVISQAHFRWDTFGRVTKVRDAYGNETDYQYNDAGQLWYVHYPATNTSGTGRAYLQYTYLYTGGPLQTVTLYDESGTQFRQITSNGGNESELLNMSGDTLRANYAYDALYRAKQVTNGLGNAIQYGYDSVGNPTSVTYPSLNSTHWGFDADQNVNQRTDALSRVTNYTLDPVDSEVDSVGYPTGTGPQFHYDVYGRLTSMTDSTGTFTYTYDDNDLVKSTTTHYNGLGTTTENYTYYPDGSRSGMSGAVYTTYHYGYIAAGAAPMNFSVGGRTVSVQASWWLPDKFILDLNGRPARRYVDISWAIDYPYTVIKYDARGQLSALWNDGWYMAHEWNGVDEETYYTNIKHDPAGNLTDYDYDFMVPVYAQNGSYTCPEVTGHVTYSYNNLDQLIEEHRTAGSGPIPAYDVHFAYDSAGNPTTVRDKTFTFNEDNQTDGYTYDSCGNCQTYRGYTGGYDYEDMLTSLSGGAYQVTNTYRADGLRASKTVNGSTTYFFYDGDKLLGETTSSGSLANSYDYGPTGLLSRSSSVYGNVYMYNFDPLGSLAGAAVWANSSSALCVHFTLFDAFGKRWFDNASSAGSPAHLSDAIGFSGQFGAYTDIETVDSSATPQVLMGARYYDPISARFVSRDPLSDDVNDYVYCGDNPVERADPSGMAYMTYDGSSLTLYHDNGSKWLSYQAVSGRPPKVGPIAAGTYRLDPKGINHLGEKSSYRNGWQARWRWELEGWGYWRAHLQNVSLDPGYEGDYYHHKECFIHGGYHGHLGTAGCISVRDTHVDTMSQYYAATVDSPIGSGSEQSTWAEDKNSKLSQLMTTLRKIGKPLRLTVKY